MSRKARGCSSDSVFFRSAQFVSGHVASATVSRVRSERRRGIICLLRLCPGRCALCFRHLTPSQSGVAFDRRHRVDLVIQFMLGQIFHCRAGRRGCSCQRGRRSVCQRTVRNIILRSQVSSVRHLDTHITAHTSQRCCGTGRQRTVILVRSDIVLGSLRDIRNDLSNFTLGYFTLDLITIEITGLIFGVHDRHTLSLLRFFLRLSRDSCRGNGFFLTTHGRLLLVKGEGDVSHHLGLFRSNRLIDNRLFNDRLRFLQRLDDLSAGRCFSSGRLRSNLRHRDLVGFRCFFFMM